VGKVAVPCNCAEIHSCQQGHNNRVANVAVAHPTECHIGEDVLDVALAEWFRRRVAACVCCCDQPRCNPALPLASRRQPRQSRTPASQSRSVSVQSALPLASRRQSRCNPALPLASHDQSRCNRGVDAQSLGKMGPTLPCISEHGSSIGSNLHRSGSPSDDAVRHPTTQQEGLRRASILS